MRLLFVARAAPHKGLADLLTAIRSLKRTDWKLTIVGAVANQDRPALLDALRELAPRLVATGAQPLDQIPSIMRRHDVLIVPSRYENFCNAALEGLACGLPVLGVAAGGIKDMVTHGVNGLLFPAQDWSALASAISWALDQPAQIRSMGVAARATAKEYSWAFIAELTNDALLSVLWSREHGEP
jgi:glycosyltransferase involved in cell wall biosynthesis